MKIFVVGVEFKTLICTGVAQVPFFCISPLQMKLSYDCFWLVLQASFKLPRPSLGYGSFQEASMQESFLKFTGSWLKATLHLFLAWYFGWGVRHVHKLWQETVLAGGGRREAHSWNISPCIFLKVWRKKNTSSWWIWGHRGLWSHVQRFNLEPGCGKRVQSSRDSRCQNRDPLYPRPAFLHVRASLARPVHALSPATPSGAVCSTAFKRPKAPDDNAAAQHQTFD